MRTVRGADVPSYSAEYSRIQLLRKPCANSFVSFCGWGQEGRRSDNRARDTKAVAYDLRTEALRRFSRAQCYEGRALPPLGDHAEAATRESPGTQIRAGRGEGQAACGRNKRTDRGTNHSTPRRR